MTRVVPFKTLAICAALVLAACDGAENGQDSGTGADAGEVNIYSYRQEALIRPLLDRFTEETGIEVNLVTGNADGLLERLKAEGAQSPADLLLTADAARMQRAVDEGVLRETGSEKLSRAIPAQYRDPDGRWYGLSVRGRVFFIAPDRVDRTALQTYADLADPEFQGRVCVRSSSSPYNQSLLASIIAHEGAAAAEEWARGVVANFARRPQGGDRDQIRAVAAGECDIALANTYYYGTMLADDEGSDDREAAEQVELVWPNQDGRGAHVNITGAGVTVSAKNSANALALIEFLASEDAQALYADQNFEFPVRAGIELNPLLERWGSFEADPLPLAELGAHNRQAVEIFDRVGWR